MSDDRNIKHGGTFKGRILKGEIIDTGTVGDSNDQPVANPNTQAPYCVINELKSSEVDLGDLIWFKVDKGTEGLMFGHPVEDVEAEDSDTFLLEVHGSTARRKLEMFSKDRDDVDIISRGDVNAETSSR